MVIVALILITVFLGIKDSLCTRKAIKKEKINSQLRIARRNESFRQLKELQYKKYN